MLTENDIDAFAEDVAVVQEFVRRYEKGLPDDRLTTGTRGAQRLARANRRVLKLLAIQNAALEAMYQEITQRSADAIELWDDPCQS